MKKLFGKQILAGLMSSVMLLSALPVSGTLNSFTGSVAFAEDAESTENIIYTADFEDGVNDFTGRDGYGSSTIDTTGGYGGGSCLLFTGREKSWQGPQILLDNMIEQGEEYIVSAMVKTPWHATVQMSMEYTDSEGTRKFSNLNSSISQQGDWAEIDETKFSIPKGVTKAYIYFECSDTNVNISVDNFTIKTAPVYEIQQDIPSLKDVFSPYFKIGGAVTTSELAPKSAQELIKKHYNSITLGNELKPESILDQSATIASGSETNPVVNIASAREILNFCRDNNISVRGHVLVWHSQTPDWFFKTGFTDSGEWVSEEIMLQRMENYIKNVFAALEEEYPTVDFYAWDVVNEAWLNDGSHRTAGAQGANGSDNSAWVQIFGDNSFIEPAFEYARKYAPEGCKLYYNDFNEYETGKTAAIVEMANDLKEKGLIDGIGMQSHLDVGYPTVASYEKALKAFSETGLDIQITELDITTSDTSEAGFEKQADMYRQIMDACVKYSDSVSAVVFWGTTDDKSWRASRCPLLFNEDFTAKPAYYSIIEGYDIPEVTADTTMDVTDETSDNILPGDVNLDGNIEIADIVLLQKYLLKLSDFTQDQLDNSDLTSDGKVNILDAVALKRVFLLDIDK
ncbi:endo-1,4-beta-xylanase [Porcipelethomonas sp.]|uniref:endo-1,4-beta-xylanase n=1 Tax=Porcipelethomonas sp. TaxID=2981675 RepID=UPI003EF75F4D